jgi:hypothetical protein
MQCVAVGELRGLMGKVKSFLILAVSLTLLSGGFPGFVGIEKVFASGQGSSPATDEIDEAAQQIFHQLLRTLQQAMNKLENQVVEEGRGPLGNDESLEHILENVPLDEDLDRAFFLDRVEELELSYKQVSALKRKRSEYQRDSIRFGAELRIAELELKELLEKDWSLEQAESFVRRIHQVQGDMQVRHLRGVRESLDILTSRQKEKLYKKR